MRMPRLRRQRAPRTVAFAFCETSHATATSPDHIRRVGEEGLKPGGGAPGAALCGRDLAHGWDLSLPVTADNVYSLSTPRPGDDRVFLCRGCADAYAEITGVSSAVSG